MKFRLLSILFLLPAIISLYSCSRTFSSMDAVVEYSNVIVYRLSKDEYPDDEIKEQLTDVKEFGEITEDNLYGILSMFIYRKDAFWGMSEGPVFFPEELQNIVPVIHRSLRKFTGDSRMVLVSRFDPDHSVLSRMERVSMIFWMDEDGLNILFGEIREPIPNNDPLADYEWKNILPVSMYQAYPDLSLVENEKFTLKTINDSVHRTWAVIPLDEVASFKPRSNDVIVSEKEDPGLVEKLSQLKKALDNELITQDEYDKKRNEILETY